MRTVNRPEQPDINTSYLERLAEEYKKSKEILADIEKRTNGMKKELSDAVEAYGKPDHNGHMWLEVGDIKLKRERRVQRSLDTASAEEWVRTTERWDDVKKVIEVLDEDKLVGLAWNNKELEEIIQSFYVEKEIWAFKA